MQQRIPCHHPSWLQVLPSHQLCPQYSAVYQSMLVSSRATERSREWSSKAWSRIYIPARIGQPPGTCRCVSADDSFQEFPPHFSRQKLWRGVVDVDLLLQSWALSHLLEDVNSFVYMNRTHVHFVRAYEGL